MMHGILKNTERRWSGVSPTCGVALLSGSLLLVNAALAPLAAEPAWTASVETQAETAYRAIYARSLDKPKPAERRASRKRAANAPHQADAVAPEMPERKPAQAAAEDNPAAEIAMSDAPKPQPQSEAIIFTDAPTNKRNGLADVLTTQVLSEAAEAAAAPTVAPEVKPSPESVGDQFCASIGNAATDARFAWQKQTLLETEKQVEKRVDELNAKIEEYQKWMARRDEFSRKAQSTITDIYAKMKPDAAAPQLSALDEETAAAVLVKLSPKISSALMAEMDPKKAARLTGIISSSSKGPKRKPPAPPTGGGT